MLQHRCQRAVVIACLAINCLLPATLAFSGELLKSRSSLLVVDANGKTVGPVFDLLGFSPNSVTLIAFEVDKQPFLLQVSPFQLHGTSGGPYFESGNCSGTPLVLTSEQALFQAAVVSAPGSTLYLADPDAQPFHASASTQLNPGGFCQTQTTEGNFLSARPVVDLATLFTTPFSLR